jgi:hypothetical protein
MELQLKESRVRYALFMRKGANFRPLGVPQTDKQIHSSLLVI